MMYRLANQVRATHNHDGAIILAIHTGQVLRLNATGSLVFQQLQNGATDSQIVEAIAERFHVSSRDASDDVYQFLQALERLELIHRYVPALVLEQQ
jgi:hypothetical protein